MAVRTVGISLARAERVRAKARGAIRRRTPTPAVSTSSWASARRARTVPESTSPRPTGRCLPRACSPANPASPTPIGRRAVGRTERRRAAKERETE
eukprot:14105207-Alexandrium_andersonii.AAC.1